MACGSRYAFATVTGPKGRFALRPASSRSLRQRRTAASSTSRMLMAPKRAEQVVSHQTVVEFRRPGLEEAIAHPLVGVLAESLLTQLRRDPLPLRDLGFLET